MGTHDLTMVEKKDLKDDIQSGYSYTRVLLRYRHGKTYSLLWEWFGVKFLSNNEMLE